MEISAVAEDNNKTSRIAGKITNSFIDIISLPDMFCHLLRTFVNSLDPHQAQNNNVWPDLDSNVLTIWWFS